MNDDFSSPSALGQTNIIRDPEVTAFLQKCEYNPDITVLVSEVSNRMVDVSGEVSGLPDGMHVLATDGSIYESIIEEKFPSIRVGFLKITNIVIDMAQYKELRGATAPFIDPVEIAKIRRRSQAFSTALPGAGIRSAEIPDSRSFFRRTVFDIFRAPTLTVGEVRLYDTLLELLKRSGQLTSMDGVSGVVFKCGQKCPTDDEDLVEDIFVPTEPGFVFAPDRGIIYLTDKLRVHEPFASEGSNRECFNRLKCALEHILMIHVVRAAAHTDPASVDNLIVIMDGPLALFGEPARFHRGIMSILSDLRVAAVARNQWGPTIIGLSKSGKVVEHAHLINDILQFDDNEPRLGTWILPIDDIYRYSFIQPTWVPSARNFGDDTYYGQNFIVRTSQGKVFDVCLAYPMSNKHNVGDVEFRESKVDISKYQGTFSRMLSCIEMMQMDLHGAAIVPSYLAQKYASIAHAPGGRSLDQFVSEVLRPKAR